MTKPKAAKVNLQELSKQLREMQLATWNALARLWQPIPVALTPVTVSEAEWRGLADDAFEIFAIFPKVLAWLQREEQRELRHGLFSGLSKAEQFAAEQDPFLRWQFATARFDLFWQGEELKIIEANCTIPAMQAYSDILKAAWLASGGEVDHCKVTANSDLLLEALLQLYRLNNGTQVKPKVLVLHRDGDSQLAELQFFQKEWMDRVQVALATPDECSLGPWNIRYKSVDYDLVYRHIFAWRLDGHPLEKALAHFQHFHIYNPVSAHYETKGFLALISQAGDDDRVASEIGLTAKQKFAIARRLPKTRIVPRKDRNWPSDCPTDQQRFANDFTQYVVKNSQGYGGQQVFIGSEWFTNSSQQRLRKVTGLTDEVRPEKFWKWMTEESMDIWVIQNRVDGKSLRTEVLRSDLSVTEVNGFVDASIFLDSNPKHGLRGGVSRFADGPLVNIGAGGGWRHFLLCQTLNQKPGGSPIEFFNSPKRVCKNCSTGRCLGRCAFGHVFL